MTITEEQRADILDSLRNGNTLEVSAKARRATAKACRDLAALDEGWAADLADAEREGAEVRAQATVTPEPPAEVAPTWAEAAAYSAQQEQERAPRKVDHAAWGAATSREEALRAKGTAADPALNVPKLSEHEDAPDWARFREEAEAEFGEGRMGLYLKQDARLVERGEPATSPWWRWTINEYFDSGLTWLIVMAGRGSGKSTTLERLLLSTTMHTPRVAPPSQEWQCLFLSVRDVDARRRIHELQTMLRSAYFIDTKIAREAIRIADSYGNPIEITSMAATIGNASGPSTVAVILDEAAKMASDGANSDTEMVTSLANTSRARAGWVGVRCSSAWQTRGSHFASIMEGTSLANYVASIGPDFIDEAMAGYAIVAAFEAAQGNSHGAAQIRAFAKTITAASPNVPTWVANPTIGPMASRMIIETLPPEEGVSKVELWLREAASMPLNRDSGPDFAAQCTLAADITSRIAGRAPADKRTLMSHPLALPGDARYAGPPPRQRGAPPVNWRARKVF